MYAWTHIPKSLSNHNVIKQEKQNSIIKKNKTQKTKKRTYENIVEAFELPLNLKLV
jgi:uncharacterized phage-associated protein